MKIKDIKKLGIDIDDIDVDIMSAIENKFFKVKSFKNYAEITPNAINYLIEKSINFHSTINNLHAIIDIYVKIICPHCKEQMQRNSGEGNPFMFLITYTCNNCEAILNMRVNPNDVISINFDKSRFTVITYTKDSNEK